MSDKLEFDLETERVQLGQEWLDKAALTQRITQAIASGDFKIAKLAAVLEQLDQAVAGAKPVTFKVSAATWAQLEAAGKRLGKEANVFARDLLVQALGGGQPAASAPAPVATPAPQVVEVTPAEEEPAIALTPKKSAAPAPEAPAEGAASEEGKSKVDRRWFTPRN